MRTRVEADASLLKKLQLYVLCAPHLEIGGWHNNAEVLETNGGRILVAFKGSTWMALGATTVVPALLLRIRRGQRRLDRPARQPHARLGVRRRL